MGKKISPREANSFLSGLPPTEKGGKNRHMVKLFLLILLQY